MAVTIEKLDAAVVECERFLKRAKEARDILRMCPSWNSNNKETGAVRRASMDLTRSLVDIRE